MSARLEPFYLANILLYSTESATIRAFPFVSKNAREALLTLKANPASFSASPRDILKYFPNINTMVVKDLTCFEETDTLPDTVTSLVVRWLDFTKLDATTLRFAERVVELRGCTYGPGYPADFSLFPHLQRLTFATTFDLPTKPTHRLAHLTVFYPQGNIDFLDSFMNDFAEQVVVVFRFVSCFCKAKEKHPPPHVRLFCASITKDIAPSDFYPWPGTHEDCVRLRKGFGAHELRAFNDTHPVPFREITLTVDAETAECDVSFLAHVTKLTIGNTGKGVSLAVPTGLLDLKVLRQATNVAFSGTDSLTRLSVDSDTVTVTPCPSLREFFWEGTTFSPASTTPFMADNTQTLATMSVWADAVDPGVVLPASLTSLQLSVCTEPVNAALLAPLTRLQTLYVRVKAADPLDLSAFTSLTSISANTTLVSRLPMSLFEYKASLHTDLDLSTYTNLTTLEVLLKSDVRLTVPSGLRKLVLWCGTLSETNLADVALESFESMLAITSDMLAKLPKTLREIKGSFDRTVTSGKLAEMFPLLRLNNDK